MRHYSVKPGAILSSFWTSRTLISTLIHREVVGRYRGSIMGLAWSFFNPVLMLSVYTFVFSEVFKSRWGVDSHAKTDFALLLFAGLIVFNMFAECINRAPSLVLANSNYVKKVVFPLDILPWVSFGSALFHAVISIFVWYLAYAIFYGVPHYTVICLPFVFLPLMLIILGVSWVLASLGVYLRDVSQFISVLVNILMFLSPIFYPASALPDEYRGYLYSNPLTIFIEQMRDILFWGKGLDWMTVLLATVFAAFFAWLGFAWFQVTRKGFADVL